MDLSPNHEDQFLMGGIDESGEKCLIVCLEIENKSTKQISMIDITNQSESLGIFSLKFIDDDKRFMAGLNGSVVVAQLSKNGQKFEILNKIEIKDQEEICDFAHTWGRLYTISSTSDSIVVTILTGNDKYVKPGKGKEKDGDDGDKEKNKKEKKKKKKDKKKKKGKD